MESPNLCQVKTPQVAGAIGLRTVLLATDFSPASARALSYAMTIASQYGSKLYLAHVIPMDSYLLGDPQALQRLRQARMDADSNLADLLLSANARNVPSQTLVDNGDVWVVLSDFITEHGIELLVMGTTGRWGVAKILLGSTAEEAMRESKCPVLTVGPRALTDGNPKVRNILYATDFSADSLAAAPYALSFAEKFGARLTLLHIMEKISESPYLDAQLARVHLNDLVPREFYFSNASESVVKSGSPGEVILNIAADSASDLIVIGARGAGALARLKTHFGSIAHKVVAHASCPVLTVRTQQRELSED